MPDSVRGTVNVSCDLIRCHRIRHVWASNLYDLCSILETENGQYTGLFISLTQQLIRRSKSLEKVIVEKALRPVDVVLTKSLENSNAKCHSTFSAVVISS
jgi:hypothetical protein